MVILLRSRHNQMSCRPRRRTATRRTVEKEISYEGCIEIELCSFAVRHRKVETKIWLGKIVVAADRSEIEINNVVHVHNDRVGGKLVILDRNVKTPILVVRRG